MSDTAPPRIWAVQGLDGLIGFNDYDNGEQEYVRADIHAAEIERLTAENEALRKALEQAATTERERLASCLEVESSMTPCEEDAKVIRSCAWLLHGNFSYDEAERLEDLKDTAPGLYYVTAYETVTVTRGYMASCREEAIAKMSRWVSAKTEEGRDFSGGSFRVERSKSGRGVGSSADRAGGF